MSPNFDPETLAALRAVAKQDEIDTLVGIVQDMSRGYVPHWQIDFVIEIIRRLAAAAADERANHAEKL